MWTIISIIEDQLHEVAQAITEYHNSTRKRLGLCLVQLPKSLVPQVTKSGKFGRIGGEKID